MSNKFALFVAAVLLFACHDQDTLPAAKGFFIPIANAQGTINGFADVQTAWAVMKKSVDAVSPAARTDAAFLYFELYTARINALGTIVSGLKSGSLEEQVAAILIHTAEEADRDLTELLTTIGAAAEKKEDLRTAAEDAKSSLGKFKSEVHDLLAGARPVAEALIKISDTLSLDVRVLGSRPFVHTVWASQGDTIRLTISAPSLQFPTLSIGVSDMLNGDELTSESSYFNYSVIVPIHQTSAYRISLLAQNNEDAIFPVTETIIHEKHVVTAPLKTSTVKIKALAEKLSGQLKEFISTVNSLHEQGEISIDVARGLGAAVILFSNSISFTTTEFPTYALNNFKERAAFYAVVNRTLSDHLIAYDADHLKRMKNLDDVILKITETQDNILSNLH